MIRQRSKSLARRSLAGTALLAAGALALPVSAQADGGTVTQSTGPSNAFWTSLPTDVDNNLPSGGTFSPSQCSITISEAVQHAMVPGEVYWGRCAGGRYVAVTTSAPSTTWFAPPPQGKVQTATSHRSWQAGQRAIHLAQLAHLLR